MKIIVLGSAAGGGFPQWNCNCHNCNGLRNGTINATARTQSSIAVSANDTDWVLINASPDILTQIRNTPALQPNRHKRDSGIAAVVLMDAQIDHVTGLLMLREGKQLPIYCTPSVWDDLTTGLPLMHVLSHYCGVQWHPLPTNNQFTHYPAIQIPGIEGISFTPLPLKSKAPPYSPHREQPQVGDNIGLLIEEIATGKKLFYAPGLGQLEPHIKAAMHSADCVLVDGTLWTEDEMITLGFSKKKSADMGHLPQSGPGGMIEVLDAIGAPRKILIHINNTNPILDADSHQRATLTQHGIEVAFDGMEITL
ncbi:pyrroloquinoline quinone biosynthesis protein PqqB [Glaciimonas sp. CA11.2]|uniref:pyrroloquinoline quinone biosynthesis protein PqqB n=1 Tax=unclassified Glaciimonas TaxID=2644401 RepID=UPI002AB447D9|nr:MULTISPECIES: pyrroloquinoline quinone biosynthesis protein PqqB [unclassified Glaciimonas]MDY7545691.1 pyrroloquinoline quinone biosynthesis protein PqqB [Glaciimonas sp. CA11.2]MEB0011660.1 pyrroloquinoline quinone biosynthesis protein PqqB [Glaciimonas sp. Cout2]MEB0081457.1 pyrroloquinoline quinone biosynthesis protein PqqB [Glaciimonas sp. Gout2]MEB0161463.1 pyrroloquinoline quinone biosynthesis protein PqqB [Glaciimonas sp. CA11.2]